MLKEYHVEQNVICLNNNRERAEPKASITLKPSGESVIVHLVSLVFFHSVKLHSKVFAAHRASHELLSRDFLSFWRETRGKMHSRQAHVRSNCLLCAVDVNGICWDFTRSSLMHSSSKDQSRCMVERTLARLSFVKRFFHQEKCHWDFPSHERPLRSRKLLALLAFLPLRSSLIHAFVYEAETFPPRLQSQLSDFALEIKLCFYEFR